MRKRLIVGEITIILALCLNTSCSSDQANKQVTDTTFEIELNKEIQAQSENCVLMNRLYEFVKFENENAWGESRAETSSEIKLYIGVISEINKLNQSTTSNFLTELERIPESITETYLGTDLIGEIAERYYPGCTSYINQSTILKSKPAIESPISPEQTPAISVLLPKLVFWGKTFDIVAKSSTGILEECTFYFSGTNSMGSEILGTVISSEGSAKISHTAVWNGEIGSSTWLTYGVDCLANGKKLSETGHVQAYR